MSFFQSSTGLKERCQRMSLKSSILSWSICTTAMARAQAQYIELGLKKSRLVWASKKRASFYFSPGSCFNYSICIFHSFISEEKKRKNFLFQKRCSIHFWIFWSFRWFWVEIKFSFQPDFLERFSSRRHHRYRQHCCRLRFENPLINPFKSEQQLLGVGLQLWRSRDWTILPSHFAAGLPISPGSI